MRGVTGMMKPSWRPVGLGAFLVMSAMTTAMASPPPSQRGPSSQSAGRKAAPPPLKSLAGLERGLWELRERGAPKGETPSVSRLCVRHPSQLMQIRNVGAQCSYFVIADQPGRAILTYQCENAGTGRTDLRVETSRLVQIEAQGITDGAPFALSLEGRRVGDCH